jgi:enoyl-CoA hydratase/carnithine racemase
MTKPVPQPQSEPVILTDKRDGIATITLNRPQARNALNSLLLGELHDALVAMAADEEVKVIVLTGRGPAFCAGADLKETAGGYSADFWVRHDRTSRSMEIHKLIPRLAVPVIAAVNGFALAGGCGLAMSCDLVVASENAQFGYPEAARGLVPSMVMVSLSRIVNRRVALDLLLSGRRVPADEALQLGMANCVFPADDFMTHTYEYAARFAKNSASAMRLTKYLYHQVSELDYDRATEYARDFNLMVRQTRDAEAGAKAFGSRANGEAAVPHV